MSNAKVVMGQAANTLVKPPVNVEDVFSTYLYKGNGSTQTITNGIDLDGEGGLVWTKGRSLATNHSFVDTERGATQTLSCPSTAVSGVVQTVTAFNSNGFSVGTDGNVNSNGYDFSSWTFRKAEKFFDVVTYTGNSVAGRTVSHNLGSVPGMMIVKTTAGLSGGFSVYHRSNTAAPATERLFLNQTSATADNNNYWNDTAPTSTEFTLGGGGDTNHSGTTYVAYLFAHNDGDGEFGPDADADIIKCGSVSGSSSAQTVDLGFEPQFILYKRADATAPWRLHDVMRGMPVGGNDAYLEANASSAEADYNIFSPTPTGFRIDYSVPYYNTSGGTYIYMAIRRGTKVPESATEVFAIDTRASSGTNVEPAYRSPFPVDMAIVDRPVTSVGIFRNVARLMGDKFLRTNDTTAEGAYTTVAFDNMNGISNSAFSSPDTNRLSWMWKRAPGYFDVVAYTGDATAGRTVSHNLGVAPEMMWVKKRQAPRNWEVYHSGIGATKHLQLNATAASVVRTDKWNDTEPTASVFTLGNETGVNGTSSTFIAYLFASLPGISKVGSFSHTSGTTQNIDCGFSSGARFVLVKQYASTGSWFVYDTERGIVSGIDPRLKLDSTAAENTGNDDIDPYSAGFTLTTNFSGGSYIFYAIA